MVKSVFIILFKSLQVITWSSDYWNHLSIVHISGTVDSSSYITIGYNENGIKIFTCQICGKAFKKNAHVKTHIENVHSGAQVQCGVCNKILKNKEVLITHSRVQHGLTKDQIY